MFERLTASAYVEHNLILSFLKLTPTSVFGVLVFCQ